MTETNIFQLFVVLHTGNSFASRSEVALATHLFSSFALLFPSLTHIDVSGTRAIPELAVPESASSLLTPEGTGASQKHHISSTFK
jgi:hypothetical protein